MAKSIRDGLQCQRCKQVVTSYEHRVMFEFVDRERVMLGDYAALSCGCEVLDYDLRIDNSKVEQPCQMVDTLRKTTILTFLDYGPHNKTWEEVQDE